MSRYILTPELLRNAILSKRDITLGDYLKDNYSSQILSGGEVLKGYYPEFEGEFLEVIAKGFNGNIPVEIFAGTKILAASIYDTDYTFKIE